MVVPMMGFVVVLLAVGVLGGIILFTWKTLRHYSPFAPVAITGALGALILCWTLALGLERTFNSEIGGAGFFGGYAVGGAVGAWLGYRVALLLRARYRRDP